MDPAEYYRLYASLTGLAAVELVCDYAGYTVYEHINYPRAGRQGGLDGAQYNALPTSLLYVPTARLNISTCLKGVYNLTVRG
jgi:hypothetical protein